jgi:hypothetical protein
MAGKPRYPKPPATFINAWVRTAIEYSGVSQAELARALHHAGIGTDDRSIVNKMTQDRGISIDEANFISRFTGYPLPGGPGLSPEEEELVAFSRRMLEADRKQLLRYARLLATADAQENAQPLATAKGGRG